MLGPICLSYTRSALGSTGTFTCSQVRNSHGLIPALSRLVFRVGVDFSSFVLCGGSHDTHLRAFDLGRWLQLCNSQCEVPEGSPSSWAEQALSGRRVERSLRKRCSQQAARAGSHQRSGAGSRVRE